jgi:two-component system OmpR family response regulator
MHILVVEDEVKLSDLLAQGLREEGHVADVALNARQALGKARSSEYDAVVLDVMLPDLDGFDTCRRLRQEGLLSPVLMLTARDDVRARVAGLDSGADDYMTKPFSFTELLARLRALARRGRLERSVVVEVGELRLDPAKRRVWRGGREISLSAQEFGLLEAFMRRPDRVLSRSQLLDYAWDIDADSNSNVVDVYVGYLRRKIDEPFGRSLLETVRGVGYRLREDDGC